MAKTGVFVLMAPIGMGDACAQVLAGLGQSVVYAPLPRAPVPLLPRLPDEILQRLLPDRQAALQLGFDVRNTFHSVASGIAYWQSGVRYADTAGVTVPLRAVGKLPQPDTAPKWQPYCDVSAIRVEQDAWVTRVEPTQLELGLERRWGRRYWHPVGSDPALRQPVNRIMMLWPAQARQAAAPVLHSLQALLPMAAWSQHGQGAVTSGCGDQHLSQGEQQPPWPGDRLRFWPWQIYTQSAVLARGSAWWYDACGALPKVSVRSGLAV